MANLCSYISTLGLIVYVPFYDYSERPFWYLSESIDHQRSGILTVYSSIIFTLYSGIRQSVYTVLWGQGMVKALYDGKYRQLKGKTV